MRAISSSSSVGLRDPSPPCFGVPVVRGSKARGSGRGDQEGGRDGQERGWTYREGSGAPGRSAVDLFEVRDEREGMLGAQGDVVDTVVG